MDRNDCFCSSDNSSRSKSPDSAAPSSDFVQTGLPNRTLIAVPLIVGEKSFIESTSISPASADSLSRTESNSSVASSGVICGVIVSTISATVSASLDRNPIRSRAAARRPPAAASSSAKTSVMDSITSAASDSKASVPAFAASRSSFTFTDGSTDWKAFTKAASKVSFGSSR